MTTVTLTDKASSTRQTILANYRQIVEKITNLKKAVSVSGRANPLWAEYQALKHQATLHIIALRLIKRNPDLIGFKGAKRKVAHTAKYGTQTSTYHLMQEGMFDYPSGMSSRSPLAMMLSDKKENVGQHLPHGANAGSFLKKAWTLVQKAN